MNDLLSDRPEMKCGHGKHVCINNNNDKVSLAASTGKTTQMSEIKRRKQGGKKQLIRSNLNVLYNQKLH